MHLFSLSFFIQLSCDACTYSSLSFFIQLSCDACTYSTLSFFIQFSCDACSSLSLSFFIRYQRQILLVPAEHTASMKSFQALQSPAIPWTSFHDLHALLISSSIVLRHVLYGLPLLYPRGFQSNAVFSFYLL